MILRITYCTVALSLCIVIGLLIEAPGDLIAETEQDQVQADENPKEYLLLSKIVEEQKQNRSMMSSQQILNDALQRELSKNEGIKQASMPRIIPGPLSHRSREKTLTRKPSQKNTRRSSSLPSRNSGGLVITSKSTTPEGEIVLSAGESDSSATVPAGFLNPAKPNSSDAGNKSSLSIFERAMNGLNRRSEPQSGANESSQSSAPRRFIPTNPKPVSQVDPSIRPSGKATTQGKIIQTQQSSSITNELEKLYQKDGRQMPQMRAPNQSRVPQGTATNQGFAPSQNSAGNRPANQQSANKQKKPPIWKRLFSIGRKKKPQQNQQPQYNPQPQQIQQPQFNNQPQFSQQPQFDQQPSMQQLPRNPSSTPSYGSRNRPEVHSNRAPPASPFGRNTPTNISRTPRPFPGNASGTRSRNSQQIQSVIPEKRRINGDAPQFNSFSEEFDPFAVPQTITEPETPPVKSVETQVQRKSDPLNDDFNPFDEPEEVVDSKTQSAESPQQSTDDPFDDNFDPFGGLENNADSENMIQVKETKSIETTPTEQNNAVDPTGQEAASIQKPDRELAPAPPVSPAAPMNEQASDAASPANGLENPFPDGSESEADVNNPDDNPFTGLTLDDEPKERNESITVPAPLNTVLDADKEQASQLNKPLDSVENSSENTAQTTENTHVKPIVITPTIAPKPLESEKEQGNESSPSIEISEKPKLDQNQQKKLNLKEKTKRLKQISDRFGLKGFKGFCPVALRDQRELINSKSKYKALFELRIYYFSSSDARDKFEDDPENYAPAYGGKDLVALRDDEKKVQGSLDHAVWFKDRLYLFSRGNTLKTFIKAPKKYLMNSSDDAANSDEEKASNSNDSDSEKVSALFPNNE